MIKVKVCLTDTIHNIYENTKIIPYCGQFDELGYWNRMIIRQKVIDYYRAFKNIKLQKQAMYIRVRHFFLKILFRWEFDSPKPDYFNKTDTDAYTQTEITTM